MAFATEKIDTVVVKESLERLRDDVAIGLEDLTRELGEKTRVLAREPSLRDDKDLDNMMKRKLHLESEIEATMETDLAFLPDDKKMLIRLAREEAESTALNNKRALNFYQQKKKELQEEKKTYEEMVNKAVKVNEKLDELLKDRSESALIDILKKRYEETGILFRELRTVLHLILTEFYPEEEEGLSMENLLEVLVTKMIEDGNDPYVNIHEGMKDYHIAFLLRANLIMRHKNDVTRIRFVDPN
ncbi:centromere protein K [Penaeus vannamei]|uniref:Putative centromere protein K n=1 Tax=Penaeus vannamei TaxID=6689 RepID=A0A423TAS1_PENVA|nr:centromere protein K-like [Penaeus vannamei]ROT73511.1 putative centromere protein K [Penaeus vannamei]